ncbi:hypothetical protein L204_102172 [Cryptococcus depauperatus]|nr:1-alkyl-2-acetylglycerophosphocholine esterase [Cryptococcus depauperatus CBS 7855]
MLPPVLKGFLPSPPGPYQVGYAYVANPPLSPFHHVYPQLKSTGQPAFQVQEISYCVFYPCTPGTDGSKKKHVQGVRWVSEPFWQVIEGYKRFLGRNGKMAWLMGPIGYITGRVQMPVYPRTFLAPPSTKGQAYPLVIFSHGLAGTRHTYSQYCSSLASEGYVVLSVEHRDGSGPAILLPEQEGGNDGGQSEKPKVLHYIHADDLVWKQGEEHSAEYGRTLQLDIRTREVYEAYHSFKRLLSPTGDEKIRVENLSGGDKVSWVDSFKGKVNLDDLRLAGHSFGGGTILHLLQTPSPSPSVLTALPVTQAIALDPWLESLPTPSDVISPPSHTLPPLLVINSPGFTEWREHWGRLVDLVKGRGTLVTMMGIGHQGFSDFPLLSPVGYSNAHSMLNQIHTLSTSFLKRTLSSDPALVGKEADDGNYQKDTADGLSIQGKKNMKNGDILLHLVGKE